MSIYMTVHIIDKLLTTSLDKSRYYNIRDIVTIYNIRDIVKTKKARKALENMAASNDA